MPVEQSLNVEEWHSLSHAELVDRALRLQWVHSIDLGNGFTTPGLWGTGNPLVSRAMADIDFRGKKVLDIGCWDGMYSFLAERHGAREVYSTDLVSQRCFTEGPTFQIARAALKSQAKYYPNLSVYDVESLGIRNFDVVLFTGIYYHLKDPLRALTCLRRVMSQDALILVEGAVLDLPGCFAQFYYHHDYCGDPSNWWVPTVECLREWVACSFFEIHMEYGQLILGPSHRYVLTARAVRRKDPLYLRVPEDLEEYNG